MQAILRVALIALASPFGVFGQDAPKPIPEKWLHEGRLIASEFNFSVSSPPSAHWSYSITPTRGNTLTLFTVDASSQTVPYMVGVWDSPLDESGQRSLVDDAQKALPKDWKVQDVHFERSNIPTSRSSRYRIRYDAPGQPFGIAGRVTLYQHGYVFSGKYSYILNYLTPEVTESPDFSRFVSSFALISPLANAPQSDKWPDVVLVGIVIIGLWMLIKYGIMKSRRNIKIG